MANGFDCGLCQVQCSSQVVLDAHLIGKQHKKKLEMTQAPTGNFRCEICNVQSTDQGGLDMHLAGKKHIKKAAQAGSAWFSKFTTPSPSKKMLEILRLQFSVELFHDYTVFHMFS